MESKQWQRVRLGDVIAVKHGWPFKSEYFSHELTGRPIVVGVGNFVYTGGFRFQETVLKEYRADYPKEYELVPGDMLLVMTCQTAGGEILGIPGRIPNDGRIYLHNQRMGKIEFRHEATVVPDFLYYLFLSPSFNRHLVITASGTKILHTAPSRIESYQFYLPPESEQRAIASILGALDDKIELNRRVNETLEAMARALFKSWFVDFDPVRAKAEGRQPAGMDAATAALFPDALEPSESGEIPVGWSASTIGAEVRVVGGSTPSTKESRYWEGGTIHWATPKDLASLTSPVLLDTERRITEAGLSQISSGLLPPGTVLLSSRAPVGYLALAEVPIAINQGFIAMVCEDILPKHYVLHWTSTSMETIKARANGTTFQEISKSNFRPIPVLVPSTPVLRSFERQAELLHRRGVSNLREIQTLAAIRDSLLPKLLSGEVRVGEAEKLVEARA
jgi:type I restriction enzyme, S subunit